MSRPTSGNERSVPAPQLRETADIWFDSGHDPTIDWDLEARRFELVDGADPHQRLGLLTLEQPAGDAARVARVLADGLAACDFPPTGDAATPHHVAAALRVAGLDPTAP